MAGGEREDERRTSAERTVWNCTGNGRTIKINCGRDPDTKERSQRSTQRKHAIIQAIVHAVTQFREVSVHKEVEDKKNGKMRWDGRKHHRERR